MLKIQDFRIGNYVNSTHKDYVNFTYVTEVQELTGWAFWHYQRRDEPNHELELRALSPIPLTEQWLLDFGFEKIAGQYKLMIGSIALVIRIYGTCYTELGSLYLDDAIQYVNQLQNLYYCLTGKELTKK